MTFQVVYKPLAEIEVSETFMWYAQPHLGMGDPFLAELERTESFLSSNPYLYPCVEENLRRANLNRYPYSLFFVIDGDTVNILSCFHQYRDPQSRMGLLKPLGG